MHVISCEVSRETTPLEGASYESRPFAYVIELGLGDHEMPAWEIGQELQIGVDLPPIAGIRGAILITELDMRHQISGKITVWLRGVGLPGQFQRQTLNEQDRGRIEHWLAQQRGHLGAEVSWDLAWDALGTLVPETRRRAAMHYLQTRVRDQLSTAERERRVAEHAERLLREQQAQDEQQDEQQRELERAAVERARSLRARQIFDRQHPERKRKIDLGDDDR